MKVAIISGAIANKLRHGGAIWTRLNWALGLKKLGFDVYFIKQIGSPASIVTPVTIWSASYRPFEVVNP